jgi:hypothetical protein
MVACRFNVEAYGNRLSDTYNGTTGTQQTGTICFTNNTIKSTASE